MAKKPKHSTIACEFFTWRLFQRDGVFYADGRQAKHDLGKHSLGTRKREEALDQLLDHRKAVELGVAKPKTPASTERISIADGWTRFLEFSGRSSVMGGVSSDSLKRYRAVRDKRFAFCRQKGIPDWNEFDAQNLESYATWLGKNHAYRTVYFELTLLKSVSAWLVEKRLLPLSSKLTYPLRKPQGTDTYCYSRAEVSTMVSHCEASAWLQWLGHVIVVLAHSGLRISELAGLRWTDVDLERDTIRVADERASRRKMQAGTARTTKGHRSRTVPIHPRLQAMLSTLERQPDRYVLHAPLGGKLLPRNVLQAFIDNVIEPLKGNFPTAAGETGFEHGRLHSFRHFFCSQAFLGGASEGEIRE